MSRSVRSGIVALALFATVQPLLAQTSAEQAMNNYRDLTHVEDQPRCARDAIGDEIIVCGKDESAKHRLPLPAERGPREGTRAATGEVPVASAARTRTGGCGTLATDTGCTGGLPVIGAVLLVAKAVEKVIEGE